MEIDPVEILKKGCEILDPILVKHNFEFKHSGLGKGSGGYYSSATYKCGSRMLELHFRYSLGLVTYHFGSLRVEHSAYMRALLGNEGGNKYPGFSDDPLQGFHFLAHDLQAFTTAFLDGNESEFARCVAIAKEFSAKSGFERLKTSES